MAEDIELSNRLVKAGTKFSFYRPFVLLLQDVYMKLDE